MSSMDSHNKRSLWKNEVTKVSLAIATLATLSFAATQPADALAIRSGLFNSNSLPANDDGSTGLTSIGFTANFFGVLENQLYVNNNGNVTFDGPLSTFTPFGLAGTSAKIIAPFFADVDTRGVGTVTYGTDTVDSHNAFGVNWTGVGYYNSQTDKLNDFQLVLVDRSDTGAGNFDIEFNYGRIQWETGGASGGTGGLGGNSAHVGYSNGGSNSFELPGSGVNGAFLDGGPNSLIANSNVGLAGRYLFQARNGSIVNPQPVPTPALLPGLLGLGAAALRKRKGKAIEETAKV